MNIQGSLVNLPEPCTYAFLWPEPSLPPRLIGWLGAIGDPCVRWNGQLFHAWFGAHDFVEDITQIGYAVSTDGVAWDVHPEPVLRAGGTWDKFELETPSVLRVGEQWRLWYCAHAEDGIYHVGHAQSDDGIFWARDPGNPIIQAGSAAWNVGSLMEPTVLPRADGYDMWAVGIDMTGALQLGHARSTDGRHWTVDASPLLALSTGGSTLNSAIEIIQTQAGYEFFFLSGAPPDLYGTSPDGIHWTIHEGLLLPRIGYPVLQWVSSPSILRGRDGSYYVWYTDSRVTGDMFLLSVRLATLKLIPA